MRRWLRAAACCCAAAAVVFVGLGVASWFPLVVQGSAVPNPKLLSLPQASTDVGAKFVPGSALPQIALDAVELSGLLEVQLDWSRDMTTPGADSKTTVPECLLADPVGTRGAYGREWTTFRKTTAQVAEDDDSASVVLAVGLYPAQAKARDAFEKLAGALRACDGNTATETDAQGGEFALTFNVDPPAADSAEQRSIQWRSTRAAPAGRLCSYDALTNENAFVEVMVCVDKTQGEGERSFARTVAEALAAKLSQ